MKGIALSLILLGSISLVACKLDLENSKPKIIIQVVPDKEYYEVGDVIELSASSSRDEDGEIVSWLWRYQGPTLAQYSDDNDGVTKQTSIDLTNAEQAISSFVVPDLQQDSIVSIALEIADNDGKSSSKNVNLCLAARLSSTAQLCERSTSSEQPNAGSNDDNGQYTLSGMLRIGGNVAADRDTNDPLQNYVGDNNTISGPQPLQNPFTLGGYVKTSGDRSDFYTVELLKGQLLTLQFDGGSDNDLDLYLYRNSNSQPLEDISIGSSSSNIRHIQVKEAGYYIVEVYAAKGATNYSLTGGLPRNDVLSGSLSRSNLTLSTEFVSGEVIIKADNLLSMKPSGRASSITMSGLGMKAIRGDVTHAVLMKLDDAQPRSSKGTKGLGEGVSATAIAHSTNVQLIKMKTLLAIKALQENPQVKLAEPNFLRAAAYVPSDPLVSEQWHYANISLPEAWDLSSGDGAVVAVLDNGFGYFDVTNHYHPDLRTQLLDGYDFVSSSDNSGDGDGIDEYPGNTSRIYHADHVAGTIVAAENNQGGVGVAYNAKVLPVRVLGLYGGTSYDLVQGIRYAASMTNDSGRFPEVQAKIINMSLGGYGYSALEQEAVTAAREKGLIIIAAAGNDDTDVLTYPASYDGVISVAATDAADVKTSYSNFGTEIDIAAPGGDLTQDKNDDGFSDGILSTSFERGSWSYSRKQGTSMSAPHVSGVIALMTSLYPDLSPNELDAVLESGLITVDLGQPGWDKFYGQGLIDAGAAVAYAQAKASGNSVVYPPRLRATRNITFQPEDLVQFIEIKNIGGGTLSVEQASITSSKPWLTVKPLKIDVNGLGSYQVTLQREDPSSIPSGSHEAQVNFSFNDGSTLGVYVVAFNPREVVSEDAGRLYVGLYDPDLDPELNSPIRQVVALLREPGLYEYTINSVPLGTYVIAASTNRDDDAFLVDSGETAGMFESRSTPGVYATHIVRDRTDLDIPLSVQTIFP